MIRVASDVSPCEEEVQLVNASIDVVCKQIKELRLQAQRIDKHNSDSSTLVVRDGAQTKGFKQRPSLKRHKQT
ncbi:hypothetical protein SESBI_16005 [Sesbania bispinosa]|nr:hypothetical protein SESBI_16005 [Sesbania bispinosa]